MSTDFLQITGFENGEFQLCQFDENEADKLRLEVAVGIEACALALWGAKTSRRDPTRKMRIG